MDSAPPARSFPEKLVTTCGQGVQDSSAAPDISAPLRAIPGHSSAGAHGVESSLFACAAPKEDDLLQHGHTIQLSASDLVGYLNCHHLTHLDTLVATGALAKPQVWDPSLEVLWERGAAHERAYVEHLRALGKSIVEVEGVGVLPEQVEQTMAFYRTRIPAEFWQELRAQNLIHEAAPLPSANP